MRVARKYRKLFQDAIVVNIPLDVTADLGVAIKKTRAKRIQALYQSFPSLLEKRAAEKKQEEEVHHDDSDPEDDKPLPPRKPSAPNMPQRDQYGSVLDYLEAKYARGVMVPDEDDEEGTSGTGEDDRGSVYDSESSFLDDSLLKRNVAEQVLSHSTHTKLGVENKDDEFFVNVGNLEVEDHDLMDYDPLEEEVAKKKKRKRSEGGSTSKSAAAKKPKKDDSDKSTVASKKATPKSTSDSAKSVESKTASKKKKVPKQKAELTDEEKKVLEAVKKKADEKKAEQEAIYAKLVTEIKAMKDSTLPRRKETSKVSLVVSEGKKPGDNMTFSNPHIPGQRCRVKVPKGLAPGGKFVVSVPAPAVSDEVDHNTFSRYFQELLNEYHDAYDDWCQVDFEYRELAPDIKGKFSVNKARLAKFDELIKEFPTNLVTPVDASYLRKTVRRVRQGIQRRKGNKTASPAVSVAAVESPEKAIKNEVDVEKVNKKEPDAKKVPPTVDIRVPEKGRVFAKHLFVAEDFDE